MGCEQLKGHLDPLRSNWDSFRPRSLRSWEQRRHDHYLTDLVAARGCRRRLPGEGLRLLPGQIDPDSPCAMPSSLPGRPVLGCVETVWRALEHDPSCVGCAIRRRADGAKSLGNYRDGVDAFRRWCRTHRLASDSVLAVSLFALGVLSVRVYHDVNVGPWADASAKERSFFDPASQGLVGVLLATLIVGSLAIRSMTSEYSSGMIRVTFAAIAERRQVLVR